MFKVMVSEAEQILIDLKLARRLPDGSFCSGPVTLGRDSTNNLIYLYYLKDSHLKKLREKFCDYDNVIYAKMGVLRAE